MSILQQIDMEDLRKMSPVQRLQFEDYVRKVLNRTRWPHKHKKPELKENSNGIQNRKF